ncbi:hypothetical protein Dimus_027482 [Dionaea muscipula]
MNDNYINNESTILVVQLSSEAQSRADLEWSLTYLSPIKEPPLIVLNLQPPFSAPSTHKLQSLFSKLNQKFKKQSQNGVGKLCSGRSKGALNIVLATAVDEIKLTWGFKGDLNKLKKRLKTLQEILLGAGTSQSLNNLQRDWVEQVKKVAGHADDLFDEFSFENLRRKLELNARYWFYFSLSTLEPPCQLDFAEWLIRSRMSRL